MTQNFSDQQLKYWIENDDPWLLNEAQKLRRQWLRRPGLCQGPDRV